MIKLSQIKGLLKAGKHEGIEAGLVCNFRNTKNTYWLDIHDFKRFFDECGKISINEKDIVKYGGIIINQKLKKVNYHYFVKELLDKLVKEKK